MKRALVTGSNGFVGRYLCDALAQAGYHVTGAAGPDARSPAAHGIDLLDPLSVRAAVDVAQPDAIVHLAAQTFVPDSIESPVPTYETNVIGTANVLQAVRDARAAGAGNPKILLVSSAEVYGAHDPADFPLRESAQLRPANPYAASKAAAEAIALGEAAAFGLDVVVTRAFNHIGPHQSERFVVASLAAQLAAVARGELPFVSVGNLSAQRDFLDVRDVVRAYVLLAQSGAAGEVYNICSGKAVAISEVLRRLIAAAHVPVEVREDPARMRPSDVPVFYGDNAKLRAQTGWQPQIALDRSLRDIYEAAAGMASPATNE